MPENLRSRRQFARGGCSPVRSQEAPAPVSWSLRHAGASAIQRGICQRGNKQTNMDRNETRPTAIDSRIRVIRGVSVMLDFDLAELYGVPTGALLQAVRRNRKRFPSDFTFSLSTQEVATLRSQTVISKTDETRGGRRYQVHASRNAWTFTTPPLPTSWSRSGEWSRRRAAGARDRLGSPPISKRNPSSSVIGCGGLQLTNQELANLKSQSVISSFDAGHG